MNAARGGFADAAIGRFVGDLAARTPAPGGGAGAAVAAAIGCALGAMAARYTTGERWAKVSSEADALARALDAAVHAALALADADAAAFAAVGAAKTRGDAAALAAAQRNAEDVPADLLAACARHARAIADFAPRCNPRLASDAWAAIHLLAGAGRAAWRTLAANAPTTERIASARAALDELDRVEAEAG